MAKKKTKRNIIRTGLVILLTMTMILAGLRISPAAEKGRLLRVAFPQMEGFTMTGEDGQHYGLVVDFLNEIAKYTGWEYEYVDVENNLIVDEFLAGKFDLMGGTYYAESYEQYFGYPEYGCGYSKMFLLARKNDSRIKSYDHGTFNGKTIGVFENSKENIRRLQTYLDIYNLDCTLKYYTYAEMTEKGSLNYFLENGEVDLLLGNATDITDNLYAAFSFDAQEHYIVAQPDNQEVLDELNSALEKIYNADPEFARELYELYFNDFRTEFVGLNETERNYISQKQKVSVAVVKSWHPLFCEHSGQNHSGVVPDVLLEIEKFTGLQFTYIECGSYAEAVEKVQRGEADLLGAFVDSEEIARQKGLARTASYSALSPILVRNKESTYPADGLTGAVLEGKELPAEIHAENVQYYKNVGDALSDVNKGKVDFYYGLSSSVEYEIQQENFTNIVPVNLPGENVEISFAMLAPVEQELFTVLNKAINNLSVEQRETIRNQNAVSVGTSHMSISSIIYGNPVLAISISVLILGLILVGVILAARYRLHVAAMQNELERAEAYNRAKSEFLSKMSHEIRTPMNAIVGLTDLTEMLAGLPEQAKQNLAKIKYSSDYMLSLINDILDMSRIESNKIIIVHEPFSLNQMLDEIKSMMDTEAQNRGLSFVVEKKLQNEVVAGDEIRLRQVILNLLSNAFKFTPEGGKIRLCAEETKSSKGELAYTFRVQDNGIGVSEKDQQRIFDSFEQAGTNYARSQGTGLGLTISSHIVQMMGGRLELDSALGKGSDFHFTLTLPAAELKEQVRKPDYPTGEGKQISLENIHILLAEDNDLNAEIAQNILKLSGALITRAKNGRQALKFFEESEPGEFKVILMDVMMPEMNGLEATRAIRALSRADAQDIPIIALTANAFEEDRKEAMAAGMTEFIPKPVDINYLYSVIHKAMIS